MGVFPDQLVAGFCDAIASRRRADRPTMIAIDGPGCSGKSSLTEQLCLALGELVVTLGTDSFFAPFAGQSLTWSPDEDPAGGIPHLRWPELEAAVVGVLPRGGPVTYREYDWEHDVLGPETTVGPAGIAIVEGLYALHPRLRAVYDFAIWVDSRSDDRMQRVVVRDGTKLVPLWNSLYVPREQAYIERCRPYEAADVFVLGAGVETTRQTFAWRAYAGR